jgi:tetratricopeptide (TPR) repeat protein
VACALPIGGLFRRRAAARGALGVVALLVLLLGLRVVRDAWYAESRRTERFGTGWNRRQLPVDAIAFAERVQLPGAVLNHLNFGGWMLHAQGRPVFIDGRLEVVGESFFNDYQRIFSSEVALEQAVQRYGIGWIIYPTTFMPELTRRLSGDARWKLAYVDGVAVIFVRIDRPDTRDDPARFVDPSAAAGSVPVSPAISWNHLPGMGGRPRRSSITRWWDGVLRHQEYPADDMNVGLVHLFRRENAPAIRRFTAAIERSDGAWYDAYLNLGSALWRSGDREGAAAAYRVVLTDDPENRLARERLAGSGTPE